ncbi:hypothetical protein ACIGGF_05640 [Rhodococcus sp. NPDC078407]|uniref:hypothetical protein n=1 Tax=Rhodococcus sp. NPDC078407 TaxID=3364509 RepID=UPI0037C6B1EB
MGRQENADDETTNGEDATTPESPKGGRPGPVDGGGGGGMATRENAPEVAENSE